jgi:hypothetical protein
VLASLYDARVQDGEKHLTNVWCVVSSAIVGEHTCLLKSTKKYHHNITSQFLVDEMYGMIVDNLAYEPRLMIRHIKEKYKYDISYNKALVVEQKVLERRFVTLYDNLS